MGAYAEYLGRFQSLGDLARERKSVLSRISKMRGGRDIMVFAADFSASHAPIGIDYTDILAVQDQLANMGGNSLDIMLETPGGFVAVVEDIVKIVREKYESVGVIVPGRAKSAGAILAMAGDEILMGRTSSLGPIDGQVQLDDGRRFSADAFLEGLERIKSEAERSGRLTPAYVPILQDMSPGEIQNCGNIGELSRHLATKWLAEYKFKFWGRHGDGRAVTAEERRNRAGEVAAALCPRTERLTHDRSIKIGDLEKLRVKVTDYDDNAGLSDAITRYYALLRTSFEMSAAYKIFETPSSQICRFLVPGQAARPQERFGRDGSPAGAVCTRCRKRFAVQASWKEGARADPGAVPCSDPASCPTCGAQNPLGKMLSQLEGATAEGRLSRQQGRHAAEFGYVDGAIRARDGRRPHMDGGRAPRPAAVKGIMDKYFDERALAETRLQMDKAAETMRISAEIRDIAEALLLPPPPPPPPAAAARTMSGQ